jgi:uncharacterized membrane protein
VAAGHRASAGAANPYSGPVAEEDEQNRQPDAAGIPQKTEDNSLGRLLTLSDGVFAIAMTLLALDLRPPNLSGHVTNRQLIDALAQHTDSYWSFILSFYIISIYWGGHRRLMRSVTVFTPNLVRDTVFLLLLVAAMPFPASLLGEYGGTPFALAVYGAISALATLALIHLTYDVRRSDPGSRKAETPADKLAWRTSWANLGVFLLCIPAGYVLGGNGPWVLLLLVLTNGLPLLRTLARNGLALLRTLARRYGIGPR